MSLDTTKVEKFDGDRDLWSRYRWHFNAMLDAKIAGSVIFLERTLNEIKTERLRELAEEKADGKTTDPRKAAIELEVTGIDKKLLEERRVVCSRLLQTLGPKVIPIVQNVAPDDPRAIWLRM